MNENDSRQNDFYLLNTAFIITILVSEIKIQLISNFSVFCFNGVKTHGYTLFPHAFASRPKDQAFHKILSYIFRFLFNIRCTVYTYSALYSWHRIVQLAMRKRNKFSWQIKLQKWYWKFWQNFFRTERHERARG